MAPQTRAPTAARCKSRMTGRACIPSHSSGRSWTTSITPVSRRLSRRPCSMSITPCRTPCGIGWSTAGFRPGARTTKRTANASTTYRRSSCWGACSDTTCTASVLTTWPRTGWVVSVSTSMPSWKKRTTPGSATAVWGVWRRAFLDSMATHGPPRIRLRDSLRVRDLRAAHSRRLAGRTRGRVAALRQSVGDPPTAVHGRSSDVRSDRRGPRRPREPQAFDGSTATSSWESPMTCPVAGYGNNTVNTLRLWRARATKEFNFDVFNDGDYRRAVEAKSGQRDRLEGALSQRHLARGARAAAQAAVLLHLLLHRRHPPAPPDHQSGPAEHPRQGGDSAQRHAPSDRGRGADAGPRGHPRRGLGHGLGHHPATRSRTPTTRCCRKRWKSGTSRCSGTLLPRHLSIIGEINRRFLRAVQIAAPKDADRLQRMAIISAERRRPKIRMAHLAVVGSQSVNGVAASCTPSSSRLACCRTSTQMWPDPFQQQDQRSNAAAVDPC